MFCRLFHQPKNADDAQGQGISWQVLALLMVLTSVGLGLVGESSAIAIPFASQSQSNQRPGDSQDQIDDLIKRLGSPSFAVRQSAVEQLWKFGNQAREQLERAVLQGDPEVAKRAKEILIVLAMGIDSETTPELASLILRFNGSERLVRKGILEDLLREEKLSLVFDLLEQVESDEDQKKLFIDVLDFYDTIVTFGRAGRWDDIEFMHRHPLTLKHMSTAAIQYHQAMGTLDTLIEQLKNEIVSSEKDGKKSDEAKLTKLISILRMQRKFDQAKLFVAKIKSLPMKLALTNQMLFEKGDWHAIAKKIAKPDEDVTPENGLIRVTQSQRAYVCSVIGDDEGYRAVIDSLLAEASECKKNKDAQGERKWLDAILEVSIVNHDWKTAQPCLDPKSPAATFGLLVNFRRVDEAFQFIGLADSVEWRDLWFNRKMRYIKTLRTKIERLDKANIDSDETSEKMSEAWELCFDVANVLGGLGREDEAVAHYHTMFANLQGEDYLEQRCDIVWRLVWMERNKDVWNLVEKGFSANEHEEVLSSLFPAQKDRYAEFWYSKLEKRYPDTLERLKVTAGIVNSPLCDIADFNLDYELANLRSKDVYLKSGYFDYQLARIYEFHGRERAFRRHMQMSLQLGYSAAKYDLVRKAIMAKRMDEVLQYYNSDGNYNSAFGSLMVAEAFRQSGDLKASAQRRALAFAYWQNRYRNSGTLSDLERVKMSHLASDFLKLQIYQISPISQSNVSNERYRTQLAQSQLESQPELAVTNRQMVLFEHFSTDDPGGQEGTHWYDFSTATQMALATSLIKKGQLKEATDLLIRCDKFAPGDPNLGEKLIGALDQAGGTQQADRLFNQLSSFYFGILRRYPESPLHHNNFAWLCASAKRKTTHMLRHAELAVAARPNAASYLDTIATVYHLTGEKSKAIETCRRCIELDPTKQHFRDQMKRFSGQ